jgi:hypothetical protein
LALFHFRDKEGRMRSLATILIGALAVASCGEHESVREMDASAIAPDDVSPDVPDAPAPVEAESTPADAVPESRWVARTMVSGPAVLFGPPQGDSPFLVRCEDTDLVFIRSARLPAGSVSMQLEAGGESRTLRAQSWPRPTPQVASRLHVGDPFAEHLARTTAPLEVNVEGTSGLSMPSDPVLRKLVADCRA